MGKPTKHRNSRSHTPATSKETLCTKMVGRRKMVKKQQKTKKTIKKLFNQLRRESRTSLNSPVISLDDSVHDNVNDMKRKHSSDTSIPCKRPKCDDSVVILDDDNSNGLPSSPNKQTFQASTPISKKTKVSTDSNSSNPTNITVIAKEINQAANDLTREINNESYLTIDLTTDSDLNRTSVSRPENTVIDLENLSEIPNNFTSISETSISGESNVTVLRLQDKKANERRMNRFVRGIANMNANEKGKLLELITKNIFNGCNVQTPTKNDGISLKDTVARATETAEDTYIKEVILGQAQSRNSIGSNIYNPEGDAKNKTGLRMVVIDGSNVAVEHGRGRVFSVKGLKICIDYFLQRGHVVKAFVPRFRCKFGKSTDPRLLDDLERRGLVVYTPSREIQGRLITSYDDRYIVQCAAEFDGVIVSGDNYRDLHRENPRWRFVIENRLLPFTWVQDMIMFPRDPLGRNGPTLEQFLKHPPNPK